MAQAQATSTAGVDREFALDFVRRWTDAWNSHQVERVLEMMAEDIVYDDSAWPRTMRGHADVREFIEHTWRAFPDLRFEMTDGPYIVPDEPKAAFYWKGYATHTGPIDPPGLAPTGKRLEMEGGDFHTYRDGRLVRLRIVFNLAETMRQLGALPEPGSRAEGVAMRLANLQRRLRRLPS
jgi:steroid delta-isomerase-like uncharacterized protein